MENGFREWVSSLPARCVALVMFSGHGLEVNAENFLLPVDAPAGMLPGEVRYKCVSLDMLTAMMLHQLNKESLIIVMLDCCRDETSSRGLQTSSRGAAGRRGLGHVPLSEPNSAAVFVGYAAAPGQVAMERAKRFVDTSMF